MENIFLQTRDAGYHIVARKGATYYGVAAGLISITQAILGDQKTVLSVSSLVHDYYGLDDVCFSLPAIVDRGGVRQTLRLMLDEDEIEKLRRSSAILKNTIKSLDLG